MSVKAVESVLSRAMSDKSFASLLFSEAEQALVGFDLTEEEIASLKAITHANFDLLSKLAPEKRKSMGDKWGLTGNHNETALKVQHN